jgi:hypothetical protein
VKRSGIIFRPATDTAMPKTWRTALPTFTVLWLILAGTLLLTAWTWPKTMTGWIVTLSLGPMLYLLAEAVGDVAFWLLRTAFVNTLLLELPTRSGRTSGSLRSRGVRSSLAVSLACVAVLIMLVAFVVYLSRSGLGNAIEGFLRRHFY